jgi:hypothetical protein
MNLTVQKKHNNPSLVMTFDQMCKMSEMIAKSDLAPKDYKGKPENCYIAIQMGQEIGLAPMQAIQSIAVINGRPCVYGDAALALVLASPVCEDIIETQSTDGTSYSCTAKRRGQQPRTYNFSIEDAKKAALWGKQGPWSNYPSRMLQMRARGFALRDKFPDVLKGLVLYEEAIDIPPEKIINPESDDPNVSQVSKLKTKLNLEKKEENQPELKPEKVSEEWLSAALAELNNIKTIDELVEECKELAVKISDIEQRKQLEKEFKKRKKEIETDKFKQDLGEVE